jgi:hypothetical protein
MSQTVKKIGTSLKSTMERVGETVHQVEDTVRGKKPRPFRSLNVIFDCHRLLIISFSLGMIDHTLGRTNAAETAGIIFITGASGVIGHRVAQRLLDGGCHNVRLGAIGQFDT